MKRKIIKINEKLCNGCGLCIPNCPEGAIQLIDDKARLISDLFCDGLGACIGHCPEGAITIEEREASSYDEKKVMENIAKQGANVIKAHLEHLKAHGEYGYLQTAIAYLKEQNIESPFLENAAMKNKKEQLHSLGCPGVRSLFFAKAGSQKISKRGSSPSQLTHWPIQLHLISPLAPQYKGKDVVLAADCTAYACGNFHHDYLSGKSLIIACPKLDSAQDVYLEKLRVLIDDAAINTMTVIIMEVPCCRGLLNIAEQARSESKRKVPLKRIIISLEGDVKSEEWV